MKKFKLYFDKEKEETWLNEMCGKGLAMTKFFLGVYTFAPCEPGAYIYQIDMPPASGKLWEWCQRKREYVAFVEGTGAEYVCSWGAWVIFRKESAKGEFELYTDAESKIIMYQRIRLLFLAVGLYEFVMSIIDTYNFWNGAKEALMAGKGLADLEGSHFYLSGLAILYLMAICMFTMVVRFTIKIRRVKRKKIFLDRVLNMFYCIR